MNQSLIELNRNEMDKNLKDFVFILLAVVLLGGGILWGGRGIGAVAAGTGYEMKAEKHMGSLDEDLRSGKLTRYDYDIRKDQIQSGSLLR